jgi:hypothetical protein
MSPAYDVARGASVAGGCISSSDVYHGRAISRCLCRLQATGSHVSLFSIKPANFILPVTYSKTTLNCCSSVGYHSKLRIAITFY